MGLREQARLDARAILEDTSGFAWPVTLISPLGVITSLRGFTTDVGQTIDPETGQAVAGRRASFSVARAALPALPEAVAESNRKPWVAVFADSQGVIGTWKIVDVLPDAAAGVVVLLLEVYQRAIITLTGAPSLPELALAGTVAPVVPLAGALRLPEVTLAGTVAPVVPLAGALRLPEVTLAGSLRVAFNGALVLPEVTLAGAVAPAVSLGGAPVLPEVTLAGSFSVGTSPVVAMLENTATAGSVSSVTDLLNSNPATQATGSLQPTGTTVNGFPALSFDGTDDLLVWPLITPINGAVRFGFALWIKFGSVAATRRLFCCTGTSGASNSRIELIRANDILLLDVYTSTFVSRRGQTAAGIAQTSTPVFLTFEFDGGQAAEADKATIWINNVKQSLTFSNSSGTPPGSTMPATLIQPTGNASLGGISGSSLNSIWGKYIYALGGPGGIAGGGLLTSAQRAALMALKPMA